MHSLLRIAGAASLAMSAAGIAYTAFALSRVRTFRTPASKNAERFTPAVTIFKPLHGGEPHLYENLRSFCEQDYPSYQVIFGAADPNDPALQTARRLQQEFRGCDIAIASGGRAIARNPKVGNLIAMRERAHHGIFVIADSDMRVGPDYLHAIVSPFADEEVGAVTCLYGGTPGTSVASQLGSMHVNDEFSPSVLVATALEPLTYCFGATMAVRRDVLDAAGGFEALAQHIGDDYALGKLVTASGRKVELSRYVVHTSIADDTLQKLWLHELRWARTIRAQRTAGFAGSVITYVLPFALLYAAIARTPISFGILGGAAIVRLALHFEARKTFAPHVAATPWLIPLRDFLSVGVWFAAFLGKRVRWRDGDFTVRAGGQMAPQD